jgi:glycosyltransferase involved in cell wall biosynthesis
MRIARMLKPPPSRHLFVVGFFRSGTSLIYNLLNLHPDIKLLYEADVFNRPLLGVATGLGRNWWETLDFYNSSCTRHGLVPQESWNDARSTREAATILYREYAGSERRYIGEKSPYYHNCLPDLAREFPGARFIVLWRNPQNIISSLFAAAKKDYFFRTKSLPLRAILGLEKMQADVLTLRAQGVPVFDLCHEDLIENTEERLRAICNFLELSFEEQMLDLKGADCAMFPSGWHHDKAKGGEVLNAGARQMFSPESVQRKVAAYLTRWKIQFRDELATRRYWAEAAKAAPTRFELMRDRSRYSLAILYSERFVPFVYGLFPRVVLQAYRNLRRKRIAPLLESRPVVSSSNRSLKISVITPSYKQLSWLRLCSASIGDQQGVNLEHIIQDAQTGPELENWVQQNTSAQLFVECDSGMYDAINRGFARATGDIVCWLNSDEQYLEGALEKVAQFFEAHPEIDIIFGDGLLVSETGALLSYRKAVVPDLHHVQAAHLNTLTCATFVRRSVVDRGFKLDTRWKTNADAIWIADLLKAKIPMAVLDEPLAVFTITDVNLGHTSLAHSETIRWQQETGSTNRLTKLYHVTKHRYKKLVHGAYLPRHLETRIYTLANPQTRSLMEGRNLGFKWHGTKKPEPVLAPAT